MTDPKAAGSEIFHPGGRLQLELFDGPAVAVLREAIVQARSTRSSSLRTPHLFLALMQVPDGRVKSWAGRLHADAAELANRFRHLFDSLNPNPEALLLLNREFLSNSLIRVLRAASRRAAEDGRARVRPADLLISLFTTRNVVPRCFEEVGLTAARLTELAVIAEHSPEA